MHAIILAAGLGQRLGALTADRPKALVRVAEQELLLYVRNFLRHPAFLEYSIVTGYQTPQLEAFVRQHWPEARLVHNPHYADGSIRSIAAALPERNEDLLVMNADHIYPRRLLARVLSSRGRLAAVCDFDRRLGPDDMKVKLSADRAITQISKALRDADGGYIGMTLIPAGMHKRYRSAISDVRRDEGEACAVERALARLAREGARVDVCDASGIRWLEVDTPADAAIADQTLRTDPGFLL